jgi:hypothetical protein
MGGLGNQLFQIATTLAYAKDHDLDVAFPAVWDTHADRPPIWTTYFGQGKTQWTLLPPEEFNRLHWHTKREHGFLYRPIPPPEHHVPFHKLYGYFQSSLYFAKYAPEIRKALQVPEWLQAKAMGYLAETCGIRDPSGWIAAHVRRGDYLKSGHVEYHVVTTPTYFNGARDEICKRIGEKRTVCWITEDPEYVYKNLYQIGDKVVSSDGPTDFACLSLFEHVILSNSTFSWWATWLNPRSYTSRILCAPSAWFGPTGHQDVETVYEEGWVRIDPTSGNVVNT